MPPPDNNELREMLEYASPYPWRREGGFIRPARENATWSIAAIEDEGGQIGGDDDIDLLLLAPQLAEEVIRLREEIAGIKRFCRDGMKVSEAEARLTDHEREKCWREGRWAAYYDVFHHIFDGACVSQRLRSQHKENQ